MVANRGLPYEPLLKANFASFETLADNNKFRDIARYPLNRPAIRNSLFPRRLRSGCR